MLGTALESDAYLEAFMNGFEFVLLAIRGRLAESDLPSAERARLEEFLADYHRIARAYQERQDAKPARAGDVAASAMPFRIEVSPFATN